MSNNQPLVSIITACYNSENFITDTIESVLKQTYTDWEWIIIDDHSKDNSVEIIKRYTDDRIKLILLDENHGAAKTRNYGIERARGRYIAFIDSDDIWLPNALEERINFLKNNNEEAVYTSYKRVNEKLESCLDDFIAEDNITYNRLLKNCPVFISTLVYDTQRIGKIFIPDVRRREDYAMILNLSKVVRKIKAIPRSLVIYRIRNNSYSRNKWLMFKLQFFVYYKFLNLSLFKSLYYTTLWAFNGLKKYGRI
ncbi:MAG: glycosyltransferase [Flavobacteriaceae bacterium]|jgi:glycosyltransferase involved in cell wall biosynthesis|nr:glycosyltransferase [Flavobacteriaceae bacterium]